MLYVGTSGWAYQRWKPEFYPADMPPRQFLAFYSSHLNSVKVTIRFVGVTSYGGRWPSILRGLPSPGHSVPTSLTPCRISAYTQDCRLYLLVRSDEHFRLRYAPRRRVEVA